MIRAKDLDGRAVVDLESAEKVGYVNEIFLDPAGGRIAAFSVSEHSSLVGGGRRTFVPPSAVESIGPEAIMVRPGTGREAPTSAPDSFPRLSHVTGRKVVTQAGKLVGAIADVLIDGPDCTIVGYQLKDAGWTGSLGGVFSSDDDFDYVRADADLRLSDELLVVPDDAVVRGHHHDHDDHHDERSAIAALGQQHDPTASTTTRTTAAHIPPPPVSTVDATRSTMDASPAAPTRHWHDVQPGFRTRWEQSSGGRGGLWEEHEPAYRYGWEMSNEPQYRGRSWDLAEPDLRSDWESRHLDRPWNRFSAAVREAWGSITDSDDDRAHSHDTVREADRPSVRDVSHGDDDARRGGYDGTRSLL